MEHIIDILKYGGVEKMNERDFKDKINQLKLIQEKLFTAEIKKARHGVK